MKKFTRILIFILFATLFFLWLNNIIGCSTDDISKSRDITLKELNRAVPPHARPKEPAMQETTSIDSLEKYGNDRVQIDCYIIVESFKNLTQAQQRAEKLINDFHANFIVLPPTAEGYYRISCGKYSKLEEAESAIKSIRTNIRSDAWILSERK
jgi:hypothetical protein